MTQIVEMKTFLSLILLALLVSEARCNPLSSALNANDSYAELEALGLRCNTLTTCQEDEEADYWLNLYNNCDCDSSCATYDTCCMESEFRVHRNAHKSENNQKCLRVHGHHGSKIFMVDSCKNNETTDDLCYSDPEENNDPFLMVPVTSSVSGITYKNYFCAVCNEDVDSEELLLWDVNIWSKEVQLKNLSEPQFIYDEAIKSWTVFEEENVAMSSPVPVTINIQQNAKVTVKFCSTDLVENCARNWTDVSVEEKCKAYMAKVTIVRNETLVKYRNPHCAVCNFEDLDKVHCFGDFSEVGIDDPAADSVSPFIPLVGMFVLEINQRRCARNMIYDNLSNKCRCNSRLYYTRNGRCVLKS